MIFAVGIVGSLLCGYLYCCGVLLWRLHRRPFSDRIGWPGITVACIAGAILTPRLFGLV